MYVADRDTYNDAFCGKCGNIMDGEDFHKNKGLCEECHEAAELPKGDIMLHCQHCKRQTQHTETETLPGGYPLFECVICDGGRI